MSDLTIHTARSFAAFYGISRERLAKILTVSLRERGGVFALAGFGFFRAELVAPKRMEIRPYTATRAEQESTPVYALKGQLVDPSASPQPQAAQPPASPSAAPASSPDAPSKYDLELQIMQEKATALRQKNILEQARLRDETVSYCSNALQILLKNLRADIDSINLDPASSARLREAIDHALSDLAAVLPAIIAGQPSDRIELELSARRADRLSASRHPQTDLPPDPQSDPYPHPVSASETPPADLNQSPPA